MTADFAAPKVFVSYAWESADHKQWVKEISVRLRVDGVELLLDQWEIAPGDQLADFMERSVRVSDAVLIICTPSYKAKSDARSGGVGYEGSVITAELVTGAARRKFIPLLRSGEWKDSAAAWLLGSVYLDFRGSGAVVEAAYAELLDTLLGRREAPPPVGSPPFPEHHRLDRPVSQTSFNPEEPEGQLEEYPFVLLKMLRNDLHDPDLLRIGRDWLYRMGPNHPSWTHVWNALMDADPHDPDLQRMGREWLYTK